MKYLLLIVICFLLVNSSQAVACNTHPFWTSFETYVDSLTELPQDVKTAIKAYSGQNSAAMTTDNVGVCADAVGYSVSKETCCTADWLQNVQIMMRNSIGKLVDKRPPIFKAIEKLEELERAERCGVFTKAKMDAYIASVKQNVDSLAAVSNTRILEEEPENRVLQSSSPDTNGPCPRQTWRCKSGEVLTTTANCGFSKCPAVNGGSPTCPNDAKRCGDGSFVSRTGDNCEFTACPAGADAAQEAKKPQDGPLKFFRQMIMKCMVKTAISQRRFLQGQVCAFCYAADSWADIQSSSGGTTTLKMETNSLNEYSDNAGKGLECMQKVIDNLNQFIDAQVSDAGLSQKCKNVFTNFKNKMNQQGNKPCPTASCSARCKSEAKLMDDGCGKALDGSSSDVNINTLRRQARVLEHTRILTDISSDTTGADAYVIDTTEEAYINVGGITSSSSISYEEQGSSSIFLRVIFLSLFSLIALIV